MNRARAIAAFEQFNLTPANRQLAEYWLSLWRGDALPKRSDFSPARASKLLPGIGLFEVRAGVSSRCRLSGSAIQQTLGRELAGLDWRQYTPEDQWATRLERNTAIANGAVGIGIRQSKDGMPLMASQELQLPFADETEDGARLILFHLDWRPSVLNDGKNGSPNIADAFHAIPLTD